MRDIPLIDKELLHKELHTLVVYTLHEYDNPLFIRVGFVALLEDLIDKNKKIYLYREEEILTFSSDVDKVLCSQFDNETLCLETDTDITVIPELTLYSTDGCFNEDDVERLITMSKTAVAAYSL